MLGESAVISLGLRYFLEVARSGSIAAAGAQHVAASAVSRQIAKLEDELGIALFERQARGMALSDAGRQLAAYASAAALEAERVATEIRHRGEQGDVTVRLAAPRASPIASCRSAWPSSRLRPQARHLRVERPEEVGRLLLEGLSQIGLRYTTVHDDRLSTEVLCRAPVYAVMCRRHALAGRRSVSVRDQPGCRCRWATRAPRCGSCSTRPAPMPGCTSSRPTCPIIPPPSCPCWPAAISWPCPAT